MSHFVNIQNFIDYKFSYLGAAPYYFNHFARNICLDLTQSLMFILYLKFDEGGLRSAL
jgi:hypothetical protein